MSAPLLAPVREKDGEPAVSVGGEGLTYGELREAAAALAAELSGAERVAVWADPRLETIVAAVAVLESGIALVPVNPKLGKGELEHVLSDSSPDVVIGGPDGRGVDTSARGGDLPDHGAQDEDAALIVYTSGTTGRPKGAVLSRRPRVRCGTARRCSSASRRCTTGSAARRRPTRGSWRA
jgi:malonyl-CoA/methylmalonyl-CoA synthetase